MSVYVYDKPVSAAPHFVGREMLLRSLLQGIDKKRSFAVCGGPKTGRTSVLKVLWNKLRERWIRRPGSTTLAPIYFDAAMIAEGGLATAVAGLWKAVADGLTDPRLNRPTLPVEPMLVLETGTDPWEAFARIANETVKAMQGTPSWCEYVLLIDNAHRLLGISSPRFEGFLRTLVCGSAPWKPAAVVAAGGRNLREHLLDELDVAKAMRPLFLGTLNRSEAEILIRAGNLPLDTEDYSALLFNTGGHPFILQRVLAETAAQGQYVNVEHAMDTAYSDLLKLFENVWSELDLGRQLTYRGAYAAPEHALMQYMLEHNKPITIKAAERALSLRPLREYAELLEYIGVAERTLKSDMPQWRTHCELWNAWYADRILRD